MAHGEIANNAARARRHYRVTFALLALAGVSYALLQSLVAPALPDIQHNLRTSVNGVSWVLTAYVLSASRRSSRRSPRRSR
jgi:predicted MFS family arabinose efflux permease